MQVRGAKDKMVGSKYYRYHPPGMSPLRSLKRAKEKLSVDMGLHEMPSNVTSTAPATCAHLEECLASPVSSPAEVASSGVASSGVISSAEIEVQKRSTLDFDGGDDDSGGGSSNSIGTIGSSVSSTRSLNVSSDGSNVKLSAALRQLADTNKTGE